MSHPTARSALGLLASLVVALSASEAVAANIVELPDGELATLQAALELAQSSAEPTVLVLPDGAWDYGDGGVEVDHLDNVVIMGQGADRTRLYRSICHGGAILRVNQSENLRVTGIEFDGCNATSTDVNALGVHLWDAKNFRVDHCAFREHAWAAVRIHGEEKNPRGVVDHCTFEKIYQGKDLGYGVAVSNDSVWLHEPFGSPKATFIEDCSFDRTRHAATANGAGRYVFRYNTVTNNLVSHAVDAHGAEGASPTGTEWIEVYKNVIKSPIYNVAAVRIRGGKGLVWDNEVRGYQIGLSLWEETSAQTGPVRLWQNDFGSAQSVGDIRGYPSWSTGKPSGYEPYTYPHPLVSDLRAKAGPDQRVNVRTDGLADAYVDASASKADDGSIVAYRWYEGGELLSSCARDVLELEEGKHTLVLEVERDDGLVEYDTAIVYARPSQPVTSSDSWRNRWFVPIVGQGRVELDVTPSEGAMTGYVGLTGRRVVDAHADLAARVRFGPDGILECRDGDAPWGAEQTIGYVPGQSVHLAIDVDVEAKRFSVTVDGQTMAEDYAFETSVKSIGQIALWHSSGSLSIDNLVVTGALAVPDGACITQGAPDDEDEDELGGGSAAGGSGPADPDEGGLDADDAPGFVPGDPDGDASGGCSLRRPSRRDAPGSGGWVGIALCAAAASRRRGRPVRHAPRNV